MDMVEIDVSLHGADNKIGAFVAHHDLLDDCTLVGRPGLTADGKLAKSVLMVPASAGLGQADFEDFVRARLDTAIDIDHGVLPADPEPVADGAAS
jgi:hypothetical protein